MGNPQNRDKEYLLRRFFEILPGFLTWATFVILISLVFVKPFFLAIFLICFDVYWLVMAFYMSTFLIHAYRRMHQEAGIDWIKRLNGTLSLDSYLEEVKREVSDKRDKLSDIQGRARKNLKKDLRNLKEHFHELLKIKEKNIKIPDWRKIWHLVIFTTYKEPKEVLETSINAVLKTDFPHERIFLVLGCEEREGGAGREKAVYLEAKFKDKFGVYMTTFHPGDIVGEIAGSGSNETWAARRAKEKIDEMGIPYENIVVSAFDAETQSAPEYFSYLTYKYVVTRDRTRASYQPLPLYNNNIWDAPALTRVQAIGSTFWQMIEAMRPERLVTFSSHSMSFKALADVDFWPTNVVSDDSRIFWKSYIHFNGNYRTVPMYTTVSLDAVIGKNIFESFINQYKQKRRWAWGIENFPYIAVSFIKNKKIPLYKKILHAGRMLQGHWNWATGSFIIAVIAWLPVFFGSEEFHLTLISYNLPYLTRNIMTIAMVGLLVSSAITLLLLPPKPPKKSKRAYLWMTLQWVLVPFIAIFLGALPAIDAETRLLLNKPLGFWVTPKKR